jgi:hypothetical protein
MAVKLNEQSRNFPSFSANDVDYLFEGNRVIVCRFLSSMDAQQSLVIRLLKADEEVERSTVSLLGRHHLECRYHIRTSIPWFTSVYIPMRSTVKFESDFLLALEANISQLRPPSRRHKTVANAHPLGSIEENVNTLSLYRKCDAVALRSPAFRRCIAFEIKPKTCLKSCSPFVKEQNCIKLRRNRFQIVQAYKDAKKHKNRPETTLTEYQSKHSNSSHVDDSYSGCANRIRRSLHDLSLAPKNYLRLFDNGLAISGWGEGNLGPLDSCCRNFLSNARGYSGQFDSLGFGHAHNETTNTETAVLLDALATILAGEDILQRIMCMQKLDVLDVEGASAVFSRLVDMNDGETAKALHKVEVCMTEPFDDDLLRALQQRHVMPRSGDKDYESLDKEGCASFNARTATLPTATPQLCGKYRILDLLNQLELLAINNELDLATRRHRGLQANEWVKELSEDDCAQLLKLWLMALAAKDCSVTISLCNLTEEIVHSEGLSSTESYSAGIKEEGLAIQTPPTASVKSITDLAVSVSMASRTTRPHNGDDNSTCPRQNCAGDTLGGWTITQKQTETHCGIITLTGNNISVSDDDEAGCGGDIDSTANPSENQKETASVHLSEQLFSDGDYSQQSVDIGNERVDGGKIPKATSTASSIKKDPHGRTSRASITLAYTVSIIDAGPKPASKIIEKAAVEDEICRIATEMEREEAKLAGTFP